MVCCITFTPTMKRFVLFFLFLNLHLFVGDNLASAGFYSNTYSLIKPNFQRPQLAEAVNKESFILKNYWEEEKIDVVNDEDDEDLMRKLVSLTKAFSAFFCYILLLTYGCCYLFNRFPFSHLITSSYRKFIAIRVLRI